MMPKPYHIDPDGRICRHDPHEHLSSVEACAHLNALTRLTDRFLDRLDAIRVIAEEFQTNRGVPARQMAKRIAELASGNKSCKERDSK